MVLQWQCSSPPVRFNVLTELLVLQCPTYSGHTTRPSPRQARNYLTRHARFRFIPRLDDRGIIAAAGIIVTACMRRWHDRCCVYHYTALTTTTMPRALELVEFSLARMKICRVSKTRASITKGICRTSVSSEAAPSFQSVLTNSSF